MPRFDMPLEELRTYMGSSPKPADFDEYWARAMGELKSIYAPAKLIPADFECATAKLYDMFFTGVGGAKIHAKVGIPKEIKTPVPCVLMYHGYFCNCGDWVELLTWTSKGYCVAALDCRGQGGLSEDVSRVKGPTTLGHIIRGVEEENPDKLLFRDVYLDCVQMAWYMRDMDEVDGTKMCTTGGSQGGALSLLTAALEPSICKVGSQVPFLCDFVRVWDMDLTTLPYLELKKYFRWRDPMHKTEKEVFYKLGYLDIQNHAPNIKADVLVFTGLMDEICPASSQFAMYNKIRSNKKMVIYPDHGHEYMPGFMDQIFDFFTF